MQSAKKWTFFVKKIEKEKVIGCLRTLFHTDRHKKTADIRTSNTRICSVLNALSDSVSNIVVRRYLYIVISPFP